MDAAWAATLLPGKSIGRFTLLRELGREPFNVLFEARDGLLERRVALKVLRASPTAAGSAGRTRHEAEIIADLAHPNLAALFDAGRCEEGPYLVYELLEGARLADRLRPEPMPPAEAVRIALSVARALAVAHSRGVAHHDLTPDRVFLCDDGAVKVLDLGVAHTFGHPRLNGGAPGFECQCFRHCNVIKVSLVDAEQSHGHFSDRQRAVLQLLHQLGNQFAAFQLLAGRLIQIRCELCKRCQFTVLSRRRTRTATQLLDDLGLCSTTYAGHRDTGVNRWTDTGVEQVSFQEYLTVGDRNHVGWNESRNVMNVQ